MVRLQQVIRGIKLREVRKGTSQVAQHPRLPITPNILLTLHSVWQNTPDHSSASLLWAAACLAFFGFLRTVEFTVLSAHSFDHECHLFMEDFAVDNSEHPSCLYVLIKQSKTDPFRQGCILVLGRTGKFLCPVSSLMAFLVTSGPLFTFQESDGFYLMRARFVQEFKRALTKRALTKVALTLTSTMATVSELVLPHPEKGIEDSVIQTLGRWKSTAYIPAVCKAISRTLSSILSSASVIALLI